MIALSLEDGLEKYLQLRAQGRLKSRNFFNPKDAETLQITMKAAYFPGTAKVRYISCGTIFESTDGTEYFFPGENADSLSAKYNMCFNDGLELNFRDAWEKEEFFMSYSPFFDDQVKNRYIGNSKRTMSRYYAVSLCS